MDIKLANFLKTKKVWSNQITYVGMIKAKNWWGIPLIMSSPILFDDIVVAKFSNYNDGEKDNLEGLVTLAIFKSEEDAEQFMNLKAILIRKEGE